MRLRTLRVLGALCATLLVMTGCASSGGDPLAEPSAASEGATAAASEGAGGEPITVGSVDFNENVILAHIYAGALESEGMTATVEERLGNREAVVPLIERGDINVLPEYSGALLAFLADKEIDATDPQEVVDQLRQQTQGEDFTVLEPSEAQDVDVLVVTRETAEANDLQVVSDLEGVADQLVIGGPAELETRPNGLPGYQREYGLQFAEFRTTDAAGPVTIESLLNGDIDVARLFSTQAIIEAEDLVVLEEDVPLQLPQQVIPLVSAAVEDQVADTLNQVGSELTTEDLTAMNDAFENDKEDAEDIAAAWLADHGF
ncbi:MAG: ABC transporter substrate-binding protein [Actinomycetota bacterium]|nr:ABC transporter substrate-binding protein [Actinomycetota bacterium]